MKARSTIGRGAAFRPSTYRPLLAGLLTLLLGTTASAQAVGTVFTYQGELRQAGEPVSSPHDFAFRLFDAADGGSQIGSTLFQSAVPVQDGLFSVELDFGPGQFAGDAQWLQIALRPAGGDAYQNLLPRTAVTATPYALAALTALDGSVSSASIAAGAVGSSQIDATQVQRRVSGSCPEGQYLRAVAQNGTVTCGSDATGNDWSRSGNAGTDSAVDFLGTTDAQGLEIRTANVRSLRIDPSDMLFNSLPTTANVVAGSHANAVEAGVRGATIAGGGADVDVEFDEVGANQVGSDYATVGGGFANRAGDPLIAGGGRFATVAGGRTNVASAQSSTVGGGRSNTASGPGSAVNGGESNQATNFHSTVAGGNLNSASGVVSAIGGGSGNMASRGWGTVAGGQNNTASGAYSFVAAGRLNCAGGRHSLAAGYRAKVRPGSDSGEAGAACFGVALNGSSGDQGSFVWADSQEADFVSTGTDQFLLRAAGGMAINDRFIPNNIDLVLNSRSNGSNVDLMLRPKNTNTAINFAATSGGTLFIARATISGSSASFTDYAQWNDSGVFRLFVDNPVKPTAGGFAAPSDARLKQKVTALDGALDRLLALRGVEFEYLPEAPAGFHAPGRHSGFIAQEVEQVFPDWVVEHDSGYKLVSSKGFDALTVEALRELRIEKDVQIEALQVDNARLRAELDALRALVEKALALPRARERQP